MLLTEFLGHQLNDETNGKAVKHIVKAMENNEAVFVLLMVCPVQHDKLVGVLKPAILAGLACYVYEELEK